MIKNKKQKRLTVAIKFYDHFDPAQRLESGIQLTKDPHQIKLSYSLEIKTISLWKASRGYSSERDGIIWCQNNSSRAPYERSR